MSDNSEDSVSGGPAKERAPIDRNTNRSPRPLKPVLASQSQDGPRLAPSLSLHPGNLEHGIFESDAIKPYVTSARAAFDTATKAIQAVYDARKNVSMSSYPNEDGYWCALGELASKKQDQATRAMDSADKSLTTAAAHVRTELMTPIRSAATKPMAAEIRAHAKALSPMQRAALIKDASREALDAILGGEAFLSGMTDVEQQAHLRTYHEKFNPDLWSRLQGIEKALELISTRGGLVVPEIERALGQSWSFIEVCRKRKAAADKALKGDDAA